MSYKVRINERGQDRQSGGLMNVLLYCGNHGLGGQEIDGSKTAARIRSNPV
jgi:hypothetical protein